MLYPADSKKMFFDVPHDLKVKHNLYIRRAMRHNEEVLCPYVDSLRERYWARRLSHVANSQIDPRILMLCGANHLYGSEAKPIGFPEEAKKGRICRSYIRFTNRGMVECVLGIIMEGC